MWGGPPKRGTLPDGNPFTKVACADNNKKAPFTRESTRLEFYVFHDDDDDDGLCIKS